MKWSIFSFHITVILVLLVGVALAAEKTDKPVFRVETGMHTSMVRAVAADWKRRFLVTASDDKTIRVWAIPGTGGGEPGIGKHAAPVRIIRPPIDEGHEGKLNAVAISPDGVTIICGGWTGWDRDGKGSIYLFDRADGSMTKRISGFPEVIKGLAYSADGEYLAVTLGGKGGFYLLRTSNWKPAMVDRVYGGDTYGVAFSPDGRVATTSWDGFVRLYGRNHKLVARQRLKTGESPHGIAFSFDGRFLAVGNVASPKVEVLSGQDLSFLYAPMLKGNENGAFSSVAWGGDGELYVSGSSRVKKGFIVRRWKERGRGVPEDFAVAASDILSLAHLGEEGVAFACAVPEIGIIAPDGVSIFSRHGDSVDFRYTQPDFRVSADGSMVQFDFGPPGTPRARFSLAERFLDTSPGIPPAGLTLPIITGNGQLVENWLNSSSPALNGIALPLDRFETSRSMALFPNGKGLVLGTDWYLRCFDRYGKSMWRVSAPGIAWAVNVTANGKLVVASFSDGTIRWYLAKSGKELLVLFPHADRKRWLLRTPSGYFDASPGGEDLAGWHVNNGPEQDADFFPVSRLRAYYYRPDVIGRILSVGDEAEAVRLADASSGRKADAGSLTVHLPPVVAIHSPFDRSSIEAQEVSVSFVIRSPSGEPVTSVRVMVNGRPVSFREKGKGPALKEIREVTIPIPAGENEIAIIAENRFAVSEPAFVRVSRAVLEPVEIISFQPRLFVLAVGIGAYPDKNLVLDFGAKDARDFAAIMFRQKGGLYAEVSVKILTDGEATREAILDGLKWLRRQATSRDTAIVFLSGHGISEPNGTYFYLPVNGTIDDPAHSAVIFSNLRDTLMNLPGHAVLFVDTCHAGDVMGGRNGAAVVDGVVNELSMVENGVVVFASSTGRQISLESEAWGNGAFTKAIIEGIEGKADYTGKGKITVTSLDLWLSERVRELTNGKQTPTTAKPRTIPDFPLALREVSGK